MTKYTHAVVHRILTEQGKLSDQLDYCVDINHAHSIAHQLLSVGAQGVAIIELKEPTIKNNPSLPVKPTNSPDQLS